MTTRMAGVLKDRLAVPLYRNGYALAASSLLTSALGLVYWLIAARVYEPADLGRAAALISSMALLADLAQINLKGALNRFVPRAGDGTGALTLRAYAVATSLAGVLATGFVLLVGVFAEELEGVLDDPLLAVWFVVSTMAWTIFVLQDSVLTGIRAAEIVPVENAIFSVAKIVLLVALAGAAPLAGAYLSWSLPVVVVVVAINLMLFRGGLLARHAVRTKRQQQNASLPLLLRYLAGDWLGYAIWSLTIGVMPLIVLSVAGPVANAHYFVAWSIAYGLYLVVGGLAQSLLVEGSLAPAELADQARRTLVESLRIVVPGAVVIALAGPSVLSVMTDGNTAGTGTALRLLALSAIPFCVVEVEITVARAQRRMPVVIAIHAAMSALAYAFCVPLLVATGIGGVGAGFLISQTAVAAALLVWRRLPARLPLASRRLAPVLDTLGDGLRVTARLPRRGGARAYAVGRGEAPVAVVLLADSPRAERHLDRRLLALADAPDSPLLPRRLAGGRVRGRRYEAEAAAPGTPATEALAAGLPSHRFLAAAYAASAPLHAATAAPQIVGAAELRLWVDEPLGALAAWVGERRAPTLTAIGRELHAVLDGRGVETAAVHGDLWPGSVHLDEDGAVVAITDWGMGVGVGLPEVDRMHLTLTTEALASGRELGAVAADYLRRPLTATRRAGPALALRPLVLLAWLDHVGAHVLDGSPSRRDRVWQYLNVDPVLEAVHRQAALSGQLRP